MKMIKKYRYLVIVLTLATSCAVPKTTELQKINEFPTLHHAEKIGDSLKEIDMTAYFNDANLIAIYQKMVVANPDFKIMQQRVLIANGHLKQSKLAFLPTIDVLVKAGATKFGDYTLDGVGIYESKNSSELTGNQKVPSNPIPDFWLGAQVSWEIDIWGRLYNKKKAAIHRYLASQEGIRLLQHKLFTDAASLYFELISLDKKLKVLEENYQLQSVAFELVSAQRLAGKATELAVQQFSAQSQNMLVEIERYQLEIFSIESALSSLMGEYGGTIVRSNNFTKAPLELINQSFSVDSIIHNRPDVKEAYLELQAMNADVKAARAAFFPKLEIGGFGAFNSFRMGTLFNPGSLAWQLLGGLTAPFFRQGQLRQEFYVTNRQQEMAFYNYQKSIIESFNELNSLLHQVNSYQRILDLKSQEFTFLDRAVDVSNDLYLTGYANYWEIINAQKQKLQSELDLVDYQLENAKVLIYLFKALGGQLK